MRNPKKTIEYLRNNLSYGKINQSTIIITMVIVNTVLIFFAFIIKECYYFQMKKTEKYYIIMIIITFILLLLASILSFITPAETKSLIPYPHIIIPIINITTTIFAFILILFPKKRFFEYSILTLQCFFTTWTNYETLGTILFIILLSFLFINGFFKSHIYLKFFFLIIFWLITLIGVFPFGLHRTILAYVSTIFFVSVCIYLYEFLKDDLASFFPAVNVICSKFPSPGSQINLLDYGLTERQIELIKEILYGNTSYQVMADKFITSISTIKGEMSKVYKLLEVDNREELRILLLQYKIIS